MTEAHSPVTIVTGGSRGIGAAVVARLARAGHDIVVCYRNDHEAASRAVKDAELVGGIRGLAVRADVGRQDDVQRLFAAAEEKFGAVTGLVNNAGLTGHIGDLVDTLGRAGEPDDIAPVIAWLFSPEAAYMTGAVVRVAGGM